MNNKFCLLTGSKGFIGSNLHKKLLERQYFVLTFNEEDIKDKWQEKLANLVKRADVIFHVGAVSSTDAKDINKVMFLNYEFSKTLFDLAAIYNVPVVYSSSAAIYGQGDNIPQTLYAWTKKAAEDYGLSFPIFYFLYNSFGFPPLSFYSFYSISGRVFYTRPDFDNNILYHKLLNTGGIEDEILVY